MAARSSRRILLVGLLMASCMRVFWKPWLALLWVAVLAAFFALMYGGVFGLVRRHDRPLGRAAADDHAGDAVDRARLPALGAGGARPALEAAGDPHRSA